MKRRDFLKNTMIMGAAGLIAPGAKLYGAVEGGYTGRLLVQLQLEGGWDVSSYCDPKVNQPGEKAITQWSESNEIMQAGNIPFAPYANNAEFFQKYYRDMLVINGVDAQTNSHSTGVTHNWSGRNSVGYPTLSAMFAARNAPEQPLSYVSFGGFSETANLVRFSRLDDVETLRQILDPAATWGEDVRLRKESDINRIRSYAQARLARQMARTDLTPRQLYNMSAYQQATAGRGPLTEFNDFLPSQNDIIEDVVVNREITSSLLRQVQLTIAGFDAGIASAADLYVSGFDTHINHDSLHEPLIRHVNDALDLLWTMAEQANLADRMTVVIASDFSRTPFYNSDNGKDHWPIGSVIVMERNPSWGNQVVGVTDEAQNAASIDPDTLQQDAGGTIIYPKHVHKALRRHLGLENTAVDQNFKFNNTEDFAFFG